MNCQSDCVLHLLYRIYLELLVMYIKHIYLYDKEQHIILCW